jgi:beta-glucosidase
MTSQVEDWLSALTLEEKALLTVGQDDWHTHAIPRLGIPSITMHDGPHGLRIPEPHGHLGEKGSRPATCFPTASAMGSSWNPALMEEVGRALGDECLAQDVQVLLGPGMNIKRTPLCGRNFEYFSEDPVLAGEMAAAWIRGVQSRGVGASLKHFACNNQEWDRMSINADVDERTLRELYLSGFERAIHAAHPWTVMAAYNRVNGAYACENPHLLRDILKGEWAFEGLVVSDWGGVDSKPRALLAGMDLEMPGPMPPDEVLAAVRDGTLSEDVLNQAVRRVLELVEKALAGRRTGVTVDLDAHHRLAARAAEECIVLLKNDGGLLPIRPEAVRTLAIIGPYAQHPHFQGAGSSHVTPTQVTTPFDALKEGLGAAVHVTYAAGGQPNGEVTTTDLAEAVATAQHAEIAVIFVGLPPGSESEGYDRRHLDLPPGQNALIEAVVAVQPRTVVVLANGAPVTMPWADRVPAIIEGWLAGQAAGLAVARVLLGQVNPSGKLAETFPRRLQDTPAYINYPGEHGTVRYGEGLFVGYRYYDRVGVTPLFPFGHGLSYTTFRYEDLTLSHTTMSDRDTLSVHVRLSNTGTMPGQEVVQLYVRDVASRVARPNQELKAFRKVAIDPGDTVSLEFSLTPRDFAYYDPVIHDWVVEPGAFEILVGPSSREFPLQATVRVEAHPRRRPYDTLTPLREFLAVPEARLFLHGRMPDWVTWDGESLEPEGPLGMLLDLPVAKLVRFSHGHITQHMVAELIALMNRTIGHDQGHRVP